jgi:NADPH:quinone reductase-like Zn-dependent oxidoreductase
MKAVFFSKPGGIGVLKYGHFPTPKPKHGEALIRVKACGMNHLDIWLRKERMGEPMPHILGSDVAGIVEKINGKSLFKKGDEVVVNPSISCGKCERCQKGRDCERVLIFGAKTQGGYAEYTCVPIVQLYPKPSTLSWVETAAFPLTYLTAWHMLRTRANLQKGETVFIWGASGGLGMAAIQIAKHLGGKVIAAVRSKGVVFSVKKAGADEAVVHSKGKVEEKVKALTNGKGVDVVFESVGTQTWEFSLAMLKSHGRVVIAGTTSGDIGKQDLSQVYVKQLSILGCRMGYRREFEEILGLINKGTLKPVIDSTFPLSHAKEAHQKMEKGGLKGKIVLKIS